MEEFLRNLEIEEIHIRDRRQFELKSEFLPFPKLKKNRYTQEFYIFIPNALQVNEDSYSKANFYGDQTNLIRYKTPEFKLKELYDETNKKSPLIRLNQMSLRTIKKDKIKEIEYELKLLGNICRSSIRENINFLIKKQDKKGDKSYLKEVKNFCHELIKFRKSYFKMQNKFLKNSTTPNLQSHFLYVDEFISNTIDYYLTGFIEHLQNLYLSNFQEITQNLFEIIANEKKHREEFLKEPSYLEDDPIKSEFILYRSSLLNKFVIDALLLNTARSSILKRLKNIVGAISAGIAMLFFFVLFIWQRSYFLINSLPFILITVFLYILKDRIKESFKSMSYRQFAKWFSDYDTNIFLPEGKPIFGKISEYFSFVEEKQLPKEIIQIRNREFHAVLETFKRPEKIIFYKKTISLYREKRSYGRRQALNIISRFNISKFLKKADNATKNYLSVDIKTKELVRNVLPKVYHLNIIMKNTYLGKDLKTHTELKKFRIILDKNGIKRVEHVQNL